MDDSHFVFKFDGTSEIEVNTLIESLKTVSQSLQDISKDSYGEPIEVRVQPFKEGSFEIIFGLLQDPQIASQIPIVVKNVPLIIKTFKDLMSLVKFFGGKKMTEPTHVGDKIVFTNENGENKYVENNSGVINSYNNVGTINNIENLYVIAVANDKIDGFDIIDSTGIPFSLNKEEIKKVAQQVSERRASKNQVIEPTRANYICKEKVVVSISKPDLAGTTLWKVVYEGHPISMKIDDEQFLRAVNSGQYSFANGTKLIIDLTITQEWNAKSNAFVNKTYSLTKFHGFHEDGGQYDLFGNPS